MIKLKTRRQPREMVLAIVAIGCVAFMYYTRVYKVLSKKLVENSEKIEKLKTDLSNNQIILNELQAKIGDQKMNEQNVPDKPTRFLSELISEINSRDSGVKVNKYSSTEVKIENAILALNLDLELESSFLDLATMVERLEEKYKFLEFRKIESSKVSDFVQKCTSIVQLSIYLDKEKI